MKDLLDLVRLVAEAADAKWAETGDQQALEIGDILWGIYRHHLERWSGGKNTGDGGTRSRGY
jgi:hypothetical protein